MIFGRGSTIGHSGVATFGWSKDLEGALMIDSAPVLIDGLQIIFA